MLLMFIRAEMYVLQNKISNDFRSLCKVSVRPEYPVSQRILSPRRFCPPGPNPLADIVPPDNIR